MAATDRWAGGYKVLGTRLQAQNTNYSVVEVSYTSWLRDSWHVRDIEEVGIYFGIYNI